MTDKKTHIKSTKADILIVDDIKAERSEAPALISYSKADFINTVAVLCTHDDTLKVAQACNLAAKICQKAGDHYNELVVSEQEAALKDALEGKKNLRYVRIEFMDGDIQYWATDIKQALMGELQLESHAKAKAHKLRPFMEIRYCNVYNYMPDHESHKYLRNLETSEVIHER